MNVRTTSTSPSTVPSSITVPQAGVRTIDAIPARITIRSTGSERASTSRSSVSASAANTARGAVSTFGTRRHQVRDAASPAAARSAPTRSAACAGLRRSLTPPRVRVADLVRIGDSAFVASVDCAACGEPNEGNRKFCGECGAPLQRSCPSCGTANPPGVKFCGECGTPLAAQGGPASETAAAPQAERRLVSVLFADLVGFTAASEGRDAEDTRELLSRYFDTSRRLIELYGGTVEKFIGDAVMAVWGTPVATEDDAERAVRAALDLVAAVTSLGDEIGVPNLRARAGVLTGEATVTVGADGQGMVAGDIVNTAARIQSMAEPGQVLAGDPTRRATEPTIVYEDAGTHELKGKSGLHRLSRAVRVVSGARGALKSEGLEAPFVGRDRE